MVYIEEEGVSRLTVHQVQASDSGRYTCIAAVTQMGRITGETRIRKIKTTAEVTMQGMSMYGMLTYLYAFI